MSRAVVHPEPKTKTPTTKAPRPVKGVRVTEAEARRSFAKLLDQVATGRVRVVIEREGKIVGFLGTKKDLNLVVEDEEDREDIADAEKALAEPGFVSLEELKAEFGLD